MEFERRTLLVQFIGFEPLTFYTTSDGTDLVQGILRSQLVRSDDDILGQEGSLSIDKSEEFLTFEPTDTKNRTLHLPVEYLIYCGALRRIRKDSSDQRNPDQIQLREFENVALANRYAQHITGPPIFVAVFHGFDNALCYTFLTQSADDSCLLVMKLMRAFRHYEQKLEQQGQTNQDFSSVPASNSVIPSSVMIPHGRPLHQPPNTVFVNNKQILSSPTCLHLPETTTNMFIRDPCRDDLIQSLTSNPNLQIIKQVSSSPTSSVTQYIDSLPMITTPSTSVNSNSEC